MDPFTLGAMKEIFLLFNSKSYDSITGDKIIFYIYNMHITHLMTRYGILGGGWAGLLSAFELKKLEPEAEIEILEKSDSDELGGLLRSVSIDGFTYDIGGPHILFSKNKDILNQILSILGTNWKEMERKNFIHFEGRLISYPFENGIYLLPAADRAAIGLEIVQKIIDFKSKEGWIPGSFYDWIFEIFGQQMGSRYLEPYNEKIWKRDLRGFDASWVFSPGRLPFPQLDDIIFSTAGLKTVGYKEQANFYYPLIGGIQTLYDSLLQLVREKGIAFKTNTPVSKIEKMPNGCWLVNSNFCYDTIISTLPPATLLNVMDAPAELQNIAEGLDYNRVAVVGFALNQEGPDQIALYVPQKDVIFHRYTWMSNLVSNSPNGKSNLIVEITMPKGSSFNITELKEKSIRGLIELGIIEDESKIIHSRVWVHEFGYPVYTKGHIEAREKIMGFLEEEKIFSVGRWGSWHYWNTDKVFEAVLFTVKKIVET